MKQEKRVTLKMYYVNFEAFQERRKALNNQIRDIVRRIDQDKPLMHVSEDKKETKSKGDYDDEKIPHVLERLVKEDKISSHIERELSAAFNQLHKVEDLENDYKEGMERLVADEPIWDEFLRNVRGIGKLSAAKLLRFLGYCEVMIWDKKGNLVGRESNPDQFKKAQQLAKETPKKYKVTGFSTITQLKHYAGQHAINGKGARIGLDGVDVNWRVSLGSVLWNISKSMMRSVNPYYKNVIYSKEKEKQVKKMEDSECKFCGKRTDEHYTEKGSKKYWCTEDKEQLVTLDDFQISAAGTPPWSQGHADNRAKRRISKIFLQHYWIGAREIKGLPVSEAYGDCETFDLDRILEVNEM